MPDFNIREWVKAQGRTEEDLKRWLCYDHAAYLNDMSATEVYNDLIDGGGEIIVQTINDYEDYINDLPEDGTRQTTLDNIIKFWAN